MAWIIVCLILLGTICVAIACANTLNGFDNDFVFVAVPVWAACWFGALCLWLGAKFFGG